MIKSASKESQLWMFKNLLWKFQNVLSGEENILTLLEDCQSRQLWELMASLASQEDQIAQIFFVVLQY